jgi:mono/diheme cytochrome c family protein
MKKILIISLCLLVFLVASSYAMSANEQMQGYALNNTHCVSCHDSVADPEKPGFTRDTWHLIINIMHKNGMEKLSDEDKGALVDYFYMIRKGLERSAG